MCIPWLQKDYYLQMQSLAALHSFSREMIYPTTVPIQVLVQSVVGTVGQPFPV